jgi:hypothetical protein
LRFFTAISAAVMDAYRAIIANTISFGFLVFAGVKGIWFTHEKRSLIYEQPFGLQPSGTFPKAPD